MLPFTEEVGWVGVGRSTCDGDLLVPVEYY
jgi:hypothetical protein